MIKKFLIMFIAVFAITINAQTKMEKEKENVAKAVEKLRLAMIGRDQKELEALILPELTYGHSGGHIDDAKEFVDKLVSGKSIFEKIEITNEKIDIVGNTAIVRHHLFANTNDAGKGPSEVSLDILLVYTKIKSDWKLLARQAVKAPKK